MRLSMLKSLTIASLLSSNLLFATQDQTISQLLKFERSRVLPIVKRQGIKLQKIDIVLQKDLHRDGWRGYVLNLHLQVLGKNVEQKDTLFSNGILIAPELIDIKTKRSFKTMMYPTLSSKYYDRSHLIAGNSDAKHKLVLFSDPLCPICIDEVPTIIKNVQKHPNIFALYYYTMPLDMHPTAKTISKASIVAKQMGIKNVDYKVYNTNFGKYYNQYEERDNKKALRYFNKLFNIHLTLKDLDKPSIKAQIKEDLKMSDDALVKGTPTLFLDGEIDITRSKYEKYIK